MLGAIPFWLGGMFYGPFEFMANEATFFEMLSGALHAWFESMSGFTTTGASVIDQSTSPVCSGNLMEIVSAAKSVVYYYGVHYPNGLGEWA